MTDAADTSKDKTEQTKPSLKDIAAKDDVQAAPAGDKNAGKDGPDVKKTPDKGDSDEAKAAAGAESLNPNAVNGKTLSVEKEWWRRPYTTQLANAVLAHRGPCGVIHVDRHDLGLGIRQDRGDEHLDCLSLLLDVLALKPFAKIADTLDDIVCDIFDVARAALTVRTIELSL